MKVSSGSNMARKLWVIGDNKENTCSILARFNDYVEVSMALSLMDSVPKFAESCSPASA